MAVRELEEGGGAAVGVGVLLVGGGSGLEGIECGGCWR